jgi:cell division protein FtsZ
MVMDNPSSRTPGQGNREINEIMPGFPQGGSGIPNIKVIGIGGGGSNAVSRMAKDKLPVVEYYSLNTDLQHLYRIDVPHRIPLGQNLTRGLGAGAQPDLGRQAAEESRQDIEKIVRGADMVFIAAGMGGGTGTGASPVVAQIAKESGALTVAVVSRPFSFEAAARRKNAEEGIARLREHVDTLVVIPNDRLMELNNQREQTYTWEEALKLADSVLQQGIQAIAEVITVPGEINVDFADIRTILGNAGQSWLAIGRGKGETRAADAAKMATRSRRIDSSVPLPSAPLLFVAAGLGSSGFDPQRTRPRSSFRRRERCEFGRVTPTLRTAHRSAIPIWMRSHDRPHQFPIEVPPPDQRPPAPNWLVGLPGGTGMGFS